MQWIGMVTEVWPDGDLFTAELLRDGTPNLTAEFSMREVGVRVEAGDFIEVMQEEVEEIYRRAALMAERLRIITGLPGCLLARKG
jgi:hypothetical protein